jgi:hypothetical protein
MFCDDCGAPNAADASFCFKCGKPIQLPANADSVQASSTAPLAATSSAPFGGLPTDSARVLQLPRPTSAATEAQTVVSVLEAPGNADRGTEADERRVALLRAEVSALQLANARKRGSWNRLFLWGSIAVVVAAAIGVTLFLVLKSGESEETVPLPSIAFPAVEPTVDFAEQLNPSRTTPAPVAPWESPTPTEAPGPRPPPQTIFEEAVELKEGQAKLYSFSLTLDATIQVQVSATPKAVDVMLMTGTELARYREALGKLFGGSYTYRQALSSAQVREMDRSAALPAGDWAVVVYRPVEAVVFQESTRATVRVTAF